MLSAPLTKKASTAKTRRRSSLRNSNEPWFDASCIPVRGLERCDHDVNLGGINRLTQLITQDKSVDFFMLGFAFAAGTLELTPDPIVIGPDLNETDVRRFYRGSVRDFIQLSPLRGHSLRPYEPYRIGQFRNVNDLRIREVGCKS